MAQRQQVPEPEPTSLPRSGRVAEFPAEGLVCPALWNNPPCVGFRHMDTDQITPPCGGCRRMDTDQITHNPQCGGSRRMGIGRKIPLGAKAGAFHAWAFGPGPRLRPQGAAMFRTCSYHVAMGFCRTFECLAYICPPPSSERSGDMQIRLQTHSGSLPHCECFKRLRKPIARALGSPLPDACAFIFWGEFRIRGGRRASEVG